MSYSKIKSSPYFYSKKYLKHFITKLIEVELKVKAKLKVAIIIPPTLRPTAAWGSRGWTVLCCSQRDYWSPEGVWREIFLSYWPRQEAKAWPGLPALASPILGPIHQSSQRKTFPHLKHKMVHRREPRAAVGHRVGGIIMATFSFTCTLSSISMSFMMKCLRYFLLEILKKTVSP